MLIKKRIKNEMMDKEIKWYPALVILIFAAFITILLLMGIKP